MRASLVLSMVSVLYMIVHASDDEMLFPEANLSSDDASLALSNSLDATASPSTDESWSLFGDTASDNLPPPLSGDDALTLSQPQGGGGNLFDAPFDNADCSASNNPSGMIEKSRVRRLDGSNTCAAQHPPPISGIWGGEGGRVEDVVGDTSSLQELLKQPGVMPMVVEALGNGAWNSFCYVTTRSLLPFGACSSGEQGDQVRSSMKMQISGWGLFDMWRLTGCSPGKFDGFPA